MNANEIAFGIEFETTLPSTDNTPIGPYHSGYQVFCQPMESRIRKYPTRNILKMREAQYSGAKARQIENASTRSTLAAE